MPPRTPFVNVSNNNSSSDPTASDDETAGWDIGSRWINTSSDKVWFCVDSTAGAAVWKDVSTAGAGSHPVFTRTSDPTANDDTGDGYQVGDHWINTTNRTVWTPIDVTLGAAIWDRLDGPRNNATAAAPTTANDNTQGYEVGSWWIDTSTGFVYHAMSVSTGAAVWKRSTNIKINVTASNPSASSDNTQGYEAGSVWINPSTGRIYIAASVATGAAVWRTVAPGGTGDSTRTNFTATVDPTVNDDQTLEYSAGSMWLNTTTNTLFTCAKADTGAALWSFIQTNASPIGTLTPGEHFLGGLLDYGAAGGTTVGEVQYCQIYLSAATAITSMRTYIDSGGATGRNVRMGIYSQTTPSDKNGVPVTRVAQTNSTTTNGTNGTFLTAALTSSYVVPISGYYWTAIVTDNASNLKLAVSPTVYRAGYLPVRRESGTGTNLPATAGTLTNPSSAIVYVAAVE